MYFTRSPKPNLCFHVVRLIWRLSSSFDSLIALLEWKLSPCSTWNVSLALDSDSMRFHNQKPTNKSACALHTCSLEFNIHNSLLPSRQHNIVVPFKCPRTHQIKERKIKRLHRPKKEKNDKSRVDGVETSHVDSWINETHQMNYLC